jgi:transposase
MIVRKLPKGGLSLLTKAMIVIRYASKLRIKGVVQVIPRKRNSTVVNDAIDWCLYKYRHLVENVFAWLKHFRAIMTRYDKLKQNFEGAIALACAFYGCLCETATAAPNSCAEKEMC